MDFDLATEKANQDIVLQAIQAGLVQSAHDCSEGGLAVAVAESCFKNDLGVDASFDMPKANLFSETQSRFVLSVKASDKAAFEALVPSAKAVGTVCETGMITMHATDGAITLGTSTAKNYGRKSIPYLMK